MRYVASPRVVRGLLKTPPALALGGTARVAQPHSNLIVTSWR